MDDGLPRRVHRLQRLLSFPDNLLLCLLSTVGSLKVHTTRMIWVG